MDQNSSDCRIDYIEFPAGDLSSTKAFYESVFHWKFTDYGREYASFADGRIAGGFWKSPAAGRVPLVVICASDLGAMESAVKMAGGVIVKETFSFPGGRRFHFTDPSGNELAVWSNH